MNGRQESGCFRMGAVVYLCLRLLKAFWAVSGQCSFCGFPHSSAVKGAVTEL